MITIEEQGNLSQEIKKAENVRQKTIDDRIKSLSDYSINDLISLRDHWVKQRKQSRRLYPDIMDHHRDALIWIEAIDYVLKGSRTTKKNDVEGNFDIKAAAHYLHVSKSKLYKMTSKKVLIFYKAGKNIWFKKRDLDDFLERNGRVKTADQKDKEAEKYVADYPLRRKKKK
ncbi:MAG: helix-turn-helix domain-containing protein [Bacteroidota bacterium]